MLNRCPDRSSADEIGVVRTGRDPAGCHEGQGPAGGHSVAVAAQAVALGAEDVESLAPAAHDGIGDRHGEGRRPCAVDDAAIQMFVRAPVALGKRALHDRPHRPAVGRKSGLTSWARNLGCLPMSRMGCTRGRVGLGRPGAGDQRERHQGEHPDEHSDGRHDLGHRSGLHRFHGPRPRPRSTAPSSCASRISGRSPRS